MNKNSSGKFIHAWREKYKEYVNTLLERLGQKLKDKGDKIRHFLRDKGKR